MRDSFPMLGLPLADCVTPQLCPHVPFALSRMSDDLYEIDHLIFPLTSVFAKV
jgi:hypothetical protein